MRVAKWGGLSSSPPHCLSGYFFLSKFRWRGRKQKSQMSTIPCDSSHWCNSLRSYKRTTCIYSIPSHSIHTISSVLFAQICSNCQLYLEMTEIKHGTLKHVLCYWDMVSSMSKPSPYPQMFTWNDCTFSTPERIPYSESIVILTTVSL